MYQIKLTSYPNYYIDNLGNVYRWVNKKFKLRKPVVDRKGYLKYSLSLGKVDKKRTAFQHRLLAQAFIPNPLNKPTVDHINRVVDDNRLENLRWATYKEQTANRKVGKPNPYRYCKRIFPSILKPIKKNKR